MWPIENSDDMDKFEKLLVDIKIRKNQVIIIINCTQHSVEILTIFNNYTYRQSFFQD